MKKIFVLGAGVVGAFSAYFLNKAGFDVTVIDSATSAASGASFANGGQLSFSHTMPIKFSPSVFKKTSQKPLFLSSNTSNWLSSHRQLCKNKSQILSSLSDITTQSSSILNDILAVESHLNDLIQKTGNIYFFESKSVLQKHIQSITQNLDFGKQFAALTFSDICDIDPAFAVSSGNITSGLYAVNDKSTNCFDLTKALMRLNESNGVKFLNNSKVTTINTHSGKISSIVINNSEELTAESYVYALGSFGLELLSDIDINLNVAKVRGYSITFDTEYSNYSPTTALYDPEWSLVYSYYGNRYLRVAGFFDFDINAKRLFEERFDTMIGRAYSVFPVLKQHNISYKWTENRLFAANQMPIIEKSSLYENLFLNTAHGHLGLTLGAYSGKYLSDIIQI